MFYKTQPPTKINGYEREAWSKIARCWRCVSFERQVPFDESHIGLCDKCLEELRDPDFSVEFSAFLTDGDRQGTVDVDDPRS